MELSCDFEQSSKMKFSPQEVMDALQLKRRELVETIDIRLKNYKDQIFSNENYYALSAGLEYEVSVLSYVQRAISEMDRCFYGVFYGNSGALLRDEPIVLDVTKTIENAVLEETQRLSPLSAWLNSQKVKRGLLEECVSEGPMPELEPAGEPA